MEGGSGRVDKGGSIGRSAEGLSMETDTNFEFRRGPVKEGKGSVEVLELGWSKVVYSGFVNREGKYFGFVRVEWMPMGRLMRLISEMSQGRSS